MILWETYFESAQQALTEGDYAKALELLVSAQEEVDSEQVRDERWLRTALGLAQCYIRLERFPEALQALQLDPDQVAGCPAEIQALFWETQAQLHQAQENGAEELQAWERWLALLESAAPDEARLPALDRICRLSAEGPAELRARAWEKRYRWASQLFGSEHAETGLALQGLIDLRIEAGLYAEAEELIQEQIAHLKEPQALAQAHARQAEILRRQGKAEEAWSVYAELLAADQLSEQALDIFLWAFAAGLTDSVQELAEAHLALVEQPAVGHLDLLTRMVASTQGVDRLHWLRTRLEWADELEHETAERQLWTLDLALALEENQQAEQAFPFWQRILSEQQPASAQGQAHLRHARRAALEDSQRISHYKMALQDRLGQEGWSPDELQDLSDWSELEFTGQRFDDARERLQKLLDQLESQSLQETYLYPRALLRLGQTLQRQGEREAAGRLAAEAFRRAQESAQAEAVERGAARVMAELAVEAGAADAYAEWSERLQALGEEAPPFEKGDRLADIEALFQAGQWVELEHRAAEFAAGLSDASPAEDFVVLLWQAEALEQQGRWEDALEGRRELPGRLGERLGADHPLTLKAQMQLGQAYNALSRFSEGERVLAQAVRKHEKAFGSDSLEVGRVLLALSESFRLQGKDNLMEAVAGRAVGLLEKHLPLGHPERLQAKRDMVQWLMDQARFAEARQQLQFMQDEENQAYGSEHPELAVTLSQWAGLETAEGNYVAAETFYRQSLELFSRGLGEAHPNVAATLNNLGQNLYRQARHAEAAELLQRALEIFEERDSGRISTMVNLGLVLQALRQLESAREWLERALEWSISLLGSEDLEVAFCCYTLAEILESAGLLEEAHQRAQQALQIREQRLGALHPETASSQTQLGKLLVAAGRTREAIPLVQGSLAIQVQALGPEHPELVPTYSALGRLFIADGQWGEAEDVLLKAVHLLDRATTQVSAELAYLVAELGQLRAAQGDIAEAVAFAARATELLVTALGASHEAVDLVLVRLAQLFTQQGSFKEAEACLKRVLEQRTQRWHSEHPRVAEIWLELASLQRAQGRLVLAETLGRKALDLLAKSVAPADPENRPALRFLRELAEQAEQSERVAEYSARLEALEDAVAAEPLSTLAQAAAEPVEAVAEVESTAPAAAETTPESVAEPIPAEPEPAIVEPEAEAPAEASAEPVATEVEPEAEPTTPAEPESEPAESEPGVAAELEPEPSPEPEPEPQPQESAPELEPEPEPEPELELTDEQRIELALEQSNWVHARELLQARLSSLHGQGQNAAEAETLHRLARIEKALGEPVACETLLVQALSLWSQEHGENHPLVATAMGDLAEVCFEVGKTEQAEGLLRRATEIEVRLHAGDSAALTPWLVRLGEIYLPHRPAQALAPLQRAASALEAQPDSFPELQGRLFWALAQALESAGDIPEATGVLRRRLSLEDGEQAVAAQLRLALLLLRSDQVEEATQILQKLEVHLPVPPAEIEEQVKGTLGHLLVLGQRLEEAEPRLLEALQLRSQRLGTQHSGLLPLLKDLALLYARRDIDQQVAIFARQALELTPETDIGGRLELLSQLSPALLRLEQRTEAEADYRQWLELGLSHYGEGSPMLLPALQALARLLQARGESLEAQSLREQAWLILSHGSQGTEVELMLPLEELARGAMEQGQWEKAEAWLRRAYAIAERHDGLASARLAYHLGEVFQATQRLAEAENAIRRSLEYRQSHLGADHFQTLQSLQALAEVYSAQGRYDAAQSMLSRCLEAGKSTLGEDHPDLAGFHRALGVLWQRTQKLDEAEKSLHEALRLIEDRQPPHPQLLPTLEALGQYYQQLDKLAQAAPFYSRALDSMEQTLGPSHLVVADALLQLGEIHRRQGDSGEAERLFRRCLEIRAQKLPKGHARLAEVRQALGQLLYQQGQIDAARELYEQALAALWSEQNQGGEQLAEALEGLAAIDLEQGRHAEAESRLQKALSLRENENDGRSPQALRTYQLLARVFLDSRRAEQAERAFKKALDIAQKTFGSDRPEVAQCLEQLGALYLSQGRYVASEALFDRALEIRERGQAAQSADSGFCLLGLARIYLAQNQLIQAWQSADAARKLYETLPNQPNLELTQAQLLLGQTLQAQGRLKEAETFFQRCLEARQKLLGNDHPEVQRGLYAFGLLLLEQGRAPQAERVLNHALRLLESKLGNDHPDLADCLHSLGLLHRSQGRGASAELHLKRALELRTRGLGSEHPDTASSLQAMAQLHLDQQNDEAAEALLKQALSIREKVLRADHPALSAVLLLLAGLYKSQERFAEAEPRLKRVLDQREKLLGASHPDTAAILQELGELYLLNSQYPQAETFLKRALDVLGKRLGEEHSGLLPPLHLLWKVYEAQQRAPEAGAIRSRIQRIESQRASTPNP